LATSIPRSSSRAREPKSLPGRPRVPPRQTFALVEPATSVPIRPRHAAAGVGAGRGACSRVLLPGQTPRRFGLRCLLPSQLFAALAHGLLPGTLLGLALFGELAGALLFGELLTGSLFSAALLGQLLGTLLLCQLLTRRLFGALLLGQLLCPLLLGQLLPRRLFGALLLG
jgi:hypothetical protein